MERPSLKTRARTGPCSARVSASCSVAAAPEAPRTWACCASSTSSESRSTASSARAWGALVGATFAAGTAPAEVEREMLAIKWEETVGGQGRRNRMPISRKLASITYTNSLELGVARGRLLTPGGLINTQQIEQSLHTLVARAQFVRDFDDLAIPFRAVATDMVKSEMVVLDQGELAVAMRASMAAPGVFSRPSSSTAKCSPTAA